MDSMSTGNASHSALTLPSAATAILNLPPPPIRVSELRLLTAVTGPAQGDNGGRVVLPLCWGVTSVWILGIAACPLEFDATGMGKANRLTRFYDQKSAWQFTEGI